MAKKPRTKLSKNKSSFFTKRKIALGIVLIALVGVVAIFVSQAAVGDAPVKKTLYCNQGNCYETQVAGTQPSPTQVWVRDWSAATNPSVDCSASGKEWAKDQNKQAPKYWVCVLPVPPTTGGNPPSTTIPAGFVTVNTDCYNTVFPRGFTTRDSVLQVPGGPSNCLKQRNYQKTVGNNVLTGAFTVFPNAIGSNLNVTSLQMADYQAQAETNLNRQIVNRNDSYTVGGKPAIRFISKGSNQDKILYIFVDSPYVINGTQVNGLWMLIGNYGTSTETGRYVKEQTDTILANWAWK